MPKTFDFYGGKPDPGTAAAFETSVRAQQGADAMRTQAAGQAAQAFQAGIGQGLAMAQQRAEAERGRAFQEQMFNRQQQAETQRQGAYMAFQAGESEKARMGRFDEMEAEQAFRSTEAEKGRRFDALQTGAELWNRRELQSMQLRYQQEQQRQEAAARQAKQKATDDAVFEATTFALSPQGAKQVYMPIKMSYLEALGLKGMPPEVVDQQIMEMFPETRPVMGGMDDTEDRSKLDAKLKWLGQEVDVEVPNEIALMRGMQHLTSVYGAEAAKAAIGELEGRSGVKPARGIKGAREVVKAHLLDQLGAIKGAGRGAQIQGGADLLEAFQGQKVQEDAVAPSQTFKLSKEMLERVGVAMDQIPQALKQVVGLGPYAPNVEVQGDRLMLVPGVDETGQPVPVPAGAQEALDQLMQNETIRAQILGVSGTPEQDRSPAEVKDMGTMRQLRAPPQMSSVGIFPNDMIGAPQAPQAPQAPMSPGLDALGQYRERVKRERKAAGGKK